MPSGSPPRPPCLHSVNASSDLSALITDYRATGWEFEPEMLKWASNHRLIPELTEELQQALHAGKPTDWNAFVMQQAKSLGMTVPADSPAKS